jgi:hypothetical protein
MGVQDDDPFGIVLADCHQWFRTMGRIHNVVDILAVLEPNGVP